MRTYRCEEQPELTDEEREEIADIDRRALRAWLAAGNHCIHSPAGRICGDCRADYEGDPSAWFEYGDHPEGVVNWQRLQAEIEQDARRFAACGLAMLPDDPNIPF